MTAGAFTPGPLTDTFQRALSRLEHTGFAAALWNRQLDVWAGDPSVHREIAARLGWLDALDFMDPQRPRLTAFADGVRRAGFTDVVLLGMGGSSLGPEVLRRVIGDAPGFPRFQTLDSVDPVAVRGAMERAGTSLFVVASKSGTTIEPSVMAAEARRRVVAAGHSVWGSRFVAITDEGTELHRQAVAEPFRDVFVNPADIGGRYSALSFFGMVPAALMGADVEGILAGARTMETACRVASPAGNPGLALGALLAAGVDAGRDKLTLLLPPRLVSFGLWVEQLVAESTGKHGTGIVPVTGDLPRTRFGRDRVAIAVTLGGEEPDARLLAGAQEAGLPLARLEMSDAAGLGAEFLRWEVATAAAGMLLGINPFDEPNVQQAKTATRVLLDAYLTQERLPLPEPHATVAGARLTLSRPAHDVLSGDGATAFLTLLREGDYFTLLAFLPPDDPALHDALDAFRSAVAVRTGCATVLGYGPRYLHSTGQLHKGGPNTGVFVVLTAPPDEDLPIPSEAFSFGTLASAQAIGDFQSLAETGRRALYVHLPGRDPNLLARVATTLLAALDRR